jgi:hypothetical protein
MALPNISYPYLKAEEDLLPSVFWSFYIAYLQDKVGIWRTIICKGCESQGRRETLQQMKVVIVS